MGFPVYVEPNCYDGTPAASTMRLSKGNRDKLKKKKNRGEVNFDWFDFISLVTRMSGHIGYYMICIAFLISIAGGMYVFNVWQVEKQNRVKRETQRR